MFNVKIRGNVISDNNVKVFASAIDLIQAYESFDKGYLD